VNDSHLDLTTPVHQLPQKYQNLYAKRREENVTGIRREGKKTFHFDRLSPADAAAEARRFVAKRMYVEATRKAEKAKQLPLFDLPTKRARVA
jgi:hypothetical protein